MGNILRRSAVRMSAAADLLLFPTVADFTGWMNSTAFTKALQPAVWFASTRDIFPCRSNNCQIEHACVGEENGRILGHEAVNKEQGDWHLKVRRSGKGKKPWALMSRWNFSRREHTTRCTQCQEWPNQPDGPLRPGTERSIKSVQLENRMVADHEGGYTASVSYMCS